MFSEKLNFLLNITGTSGGELAAATSLDASYISRLRSGGRQLPKNHSFLPAMSMFFSQHLSTDYQKNIICQAMQYKTKWPEDNRRAAKLVYNWLLSDTAVHKEMIQSVVAKVFRTPTPDATPADMDDVRAMIDDANPKEHYFGPEGKREALLQLLAIAAVAPAEHGGCMYLYSNEDLDWLSSLKEYYDKLIPLLALCKSNGRSLKICHTLGKNNEATLYSVKKWTPYYLTGLFEPYYFTEARDDLYKRTMLVVPGIAAYLSLSNCGTDENCLTFLMRDPAAVASMEKDIENLFSGSKKVADVYTKATGSDFWGMLRNVSDFKENVIVMKSFPLEYVLLNSLSITGVSKGGFSMDCATFEKQLRKCSVTEIVQKPSVDELMRTGVNIQLSPFTSGKKMCFTKDQTRANLDYIIKLMESRPNYNMIFSTDVPANSFMLARQGKDLLIAKTGENPIAFYITSPVLVTAGWEYLSDVASKLAIDRDVQKEELRKIRAEL